MQAHHDHDRIIDIGIERVLVLEEPAGWFDLDVDAPIARSPHFLRQQPVDAASHNVGWRRFGCRQRPQCDRRVPDRRLARLQPDGVVFFDNQRFQLLQALTHLSTVCRIAEASQRDNAPDNRREDRAKSVTFFESLQHPNFRGTERALA